MAIKKAKKKSSSDGDLAGDVGIIRGQGRSRTTQRVIDQTKRKKTNSGIGYIKQFKGNVSDNAGKVGAIKGSVKYGDASGFVGGEPVHGRGRTLQRAIDQAKRNPKKKNVKRGAK